MSGVNTNLTNQVITGSGTVGSSSALLELNTTATTSSSAQLTSSRFLKYRPGQGALGRFTALFTTGAANSKQYAGLGTPSLDNGFFFGYDGATFGICHINDSSEVWVAQSSWNVDVCDGTAGSTNKSGFDLDPTQGNIYQIKYQYLGFGNIKFYVENSDDGEFILVHVIKYANSNTATSLSQPSLNLLWNVTNTTNNTDIAIKAGSGALFVEGIKKRLGSKYSRDNSKGAITTETNIISIRNATTYNGITNAAPIVINTLSIASNKSGSIAGTAIVRLKKGVSLGGSPSFAANDGSTADNGVTITSGQSTVSYDTAGTTITGGTQIYAACIVVGGNDVIPLEGIEIEPGETLTISAQSDDSSTVQVAVDWVEEV